MPSRNVYRTRPGPYGHTGTPAHFRCSLFREGRGSRNLSGKRGYAGLFACISSLYHRTADARVLPIKHIFFLYLSLSYCRAHLCLPVTAVSPVFSLCSRLAETFLLLSEMTMRGSATAGIAAGIAVLAAISGTPLSVSTAQHIIYYASVLSQVKAQYGCTLSTRLGTHLLECASR